MAPTTIVSEDCGSEPEAPIEGDGESTVAIIAPEQCDATVTNVFAEATTTTTTTTTTPTTTTTQPSGVVEADAATPTVASPTFTG